MSNTKETRAISHMLYALADEIRGEEGCVTESAENVEEAAERLDIQTITINVLQKQRDEIIAALEKFMNSHEECTDFDGFTAQIVSMGDYHEAQEAIASVKGEA